MDSETVMLSQFSLDRKIIFDLIASRNHFKRAATYGEESLANLSVIHCKNW